MAKEGKYTNRLVRKAAVLLMVACLIGFGAVAVSAQADLTGVEWQLISMADAATGETTTIPDPGQYTLSFNDDGTVSGQADCNRHTGTFTQDSNGLDIVLGASTLALCDEDSLEFIFRSALDNAVSGAINGEGNLVLETAGGAQQLVFRSASASDAAAGTTTSTGWLGLPWWLWALLGLLLLGLLWWLFGRSTPASPPPVRATTPEPPPMRTVTPEPPPMRTVTPDPSPLPSRDDLTRIEGIGPKIEQILNNAGLLSFMGLSTTTVEQLRDILAAADLRGAYADPTSWPAQARLAAEGKWAELEAMQNQLKGGRAV